MNRLSSLLKPEVRSIQDAERYTFRWFYAGFLSIFLGAILTLTIVLSPVGITLMGIGGAIILLTIGWLVIASRNNSIKKACPRCDKVNTIFKEERFFKCMKCGYFMVLHE